MKAVLKKVGGRKVKFATDSDGSESKKTSFGGQNYVVEDVEALSEPSFTELTNPSEEVSPLSFLLTFS